MRGLLLALTLFFVALASLLAATGGVRGANVLDFQGHVPGVAHASEVRPLHGGAHTLDSLRISEKTVESESESESESEDGDDPSEEELALTPDLSFACPAAVAERWRPAPLADANGRFHVAPETPPPRA